jgi:DNA-binding winged helix-turn-helix (wHTH) protein
MGALVGRIGELVRREELTYALDMAGRRMERSVDHHVRLLRRLLGDLGCQELTIDAVYGLGYRLRFRSEEVGHG